MKMDKFSARFEIKQADGESGVFEGVASVFGNRDEFNDIVEPGAFADTLREKGIDGIKMLAHHDSREPIGVWERLEETDAGLEVRGRLLVGEVQRATEIHALMKAGALDGLSIGFRTVRSEDDATGVRHIFEVELFEISPVTFPANPEARVTDVKHAASEIETERDFEGFLRDAGFSRQEARAITAAGFKARSQRDADGELEPWAADCTEAVNQL